MEAFIGTIIPFAGNFAPRGWAMCNGQLLPISQNTALFSILGTTYGGDGQTTFALPDLRGRVPLHMGQGPGLTSRDLGESGGAENVTLTVPNLPKHTHTFYAAATGDGQSSPTNNTLGKTAANIYTTNSPDTAMNSNIIGGTGTNQPFGIMPPFLTLNFIICQEGIYPSRT